MKKILFSVILGFSLLAFSGCSVDEMSSLPEITKPYTGVYECESLMLGGRDFLPHFEKLYLELEPSGSFALHYSADGRKGGYEGKYERNEEEQTITFYSYVGRRAQAYTFPMQKGKIYVEYNLGGQLLHGVFAAP